MPEDAEGACPMTEFNPLLAPAFPLLDQIETPADLRALPAEQLPQLAAELRGFLMSRFLRPAGIWLPGSAWLS